MIQQFILSPILNDLLKDMAENIDEETDNPEALADESKDTVPEKVNISLHRFRT